MKKLLLGSLVFLPVSILFMSWTALAAAPKAHPPLKVMSFNIRYGAADDGENSWSHRRDLVRETIRVFNPDLLGLQEVLEFQAEFLQENLREYEFHGVGREDGTTKGEFVPVMYKRDRFERLDAGHFWLSETPEIPGSKSWDSSLPRMLSWVALRDRRSSHDAFVFANVHFDHRGKEARKESARLMRQRADEIEGQYPVIITGDFNTTEDLQPYAILVQARESNGEKLVDTYRGVHPVRSRFESTSSRWTGRREGSRIDWILHSSEFKTLKASINYTQDEGRYPSDHYPVEAVIRLRP
jgi:endonuclease/exonuclease/phosphatase family metal-dependent hydrolase